eukprot:gene26140-32673_t
MEFEGSGIITSLLFKFEGEWRKGKRHFGQIQIDEALWNRLSASAPLTATRRIEWRPSDLVNEEVNAKNAQSAAEFEKLFCRLNKGQTEEEEEEEDQSVCDGDMKLEDIGSDYIDPKSVEILFFGRPLTDYCFQCFGTMKVAEICYYKDRYDFGYFKFEFTQYAEMKEKDSFHRLVNDTVAWRDVPRVRHFVNSKACRVVRDTQRHEFDHYTQSMSMDVLCKLHTEWPLLRIVVSDRTARLIMLSTALRWREIWSWAELPSQFSVF